jgi:tetratricopeptide (TPR) repeat protein
MFQFKTLMRAALASMLCAQFVLPACAAPAAEENPAPPGYDAAVKLYGEKKYAPAAAAFEKFVKAGTDNSDVRMYLGACYQQLKKYDQALAQFDWVAKNAKLISVQNKGKKAAFTLRSYRAGICPGNCLKRSMPGWAHYPGLDPNLLWMKFTYSGGWIAYSTNHLGEVVEYVNGKPVNKGKCPICGGTGQVAKLQ